MGLIVVDQYCRAHFLGAEAQYWVNGAVILGIFSSSTATFDFKPRSRHGLGVSQVSQKFLVLSRPLAKKDTFPFG